MMSISYLFEALADGKITQEMQKHFVKRTNLHIDLVIKYLDKIINLNDSRLDNNILEKEKTHDQSKFKDPEVNPYIFISWSYYIKNQGKEYDPPKDIQTQMQVASFHHVSTNRHHPEFWDKDTTVDSINRADRDTPPDRMVDATKMPLSYIAAMTADWLAMSAEKKTCPYEWSKKNINIRWKFTKEQEKLIYDLLDRLWKK